MPEGAALRPRPRAPPGGTAPLPSRRNGARRGGGGTPRLTVKAAPPITEPLPSLSAMARREGARRARGARLGEAGGRFLRSLLRPLRPRLRLLFPAPAACGCRRRAPLRAPTPPNQRPPPGGAGQSEEGKGAGTGARAAVPWAGSPWEPPFSGAPSGALLKGPRPALRAAGFRARCRFPVWKIRWLRLLRSPQTWERRNTGSPWHLGDSWIYHARALRFVGKAGTEGEFLALPQPEEGRDPCGALSDGSRGQGLQPDPGAEGCEGQVPPSLQEIRMLHAWGDTLEEAFEQCAMAMFGYMTDTGTVEPVDTVEVEAEGHDLLSLLFHFLDEWLYKFSADEFFIPREVKVLHIDRRQFKIRSIGWGEEFSLAKHPQVSSASFFPFQREEVWCPLNQTFEFCRDQNINVAEVPLSSRSHFLHGFVNVSLKLLA
uniref:Protein archease n=1 Tax=Taeniopygia guttata TaxID=59729 RepID=A0A674GGU1_TAEGU